LSRSGYVCAGGETLLSILDKFFRHKDFRNHFTNDDVANFFSNTCNKILHSFGQSFAGRRNYDKYIDKEVEMLSKLKGFKFSKPLELLIDSGGFQASVGILDRRELDILEKLYYKFVEEDNHVYDRAFILDIPPGPGCKLFDSFDDIYARNLESYLTAAKLPDQARNKIIYIHHFRTPKLWDIYTKIMVENDLFDKFQYHATGGIVANSSSDTSIPCIIYILPLIPLLNQAIKAKRSKLFFHVLGGATFRDILFYELFTIHVKNIHDIDLEITYDSSGLFKGLMVGRFVPLLDDFTVKKIDLRENVLPLRYKDDTTILDKYKQLLNDMADKHHFKNIPLNEVYDKETGTFWEENRVYSLMYMLDVYSQVQDWLRGEAAIIYKDYIEGNVEEFNTKAEWITRNINHGKITKKQKAKTTSISRSLDMLTTLDEDMCLYVVNKCLAKDEFVDLMPERKEFFI